MGSRAYALPDTLDTRDTLPEPPSEVRDWRHVVFLILTPAGGGCAQASARADGLTERWLTACYHLTAQVMCVSPWAAFLDLGVCTDAEARAALQPLIAHLRQELRVEPRVGIAASLVLAQLALLTIPAPASAHISPVTPVLVSPTRTPAFLRRVPVAVLPRLHPAGSIPQEVVERLYRYGLSTVGHLARLGELALRRQFGPAVGAALAAVASGRDLYPLQPTPQPERLHFRLRFTAAPASPDRVLALLPRFMRRVSGQLRGSGRQAREVCLTLRWECSEDRGRDGRERLRCILRQHTDDPAVLTAAAQRLLFPLLQEEQPAQEEQPVELERSECLLAELWLTLTDFIPATPEQGTFWRTDRQRVAALEQAAEALRRRHGRPLVLRPQLCIPDAVFSEECHRLVALHAANAADTASGSTLVAPVSPAPDVWQDVPMRPHWW